MFTAGSLIYDIPIVFYNEDKTPYIPMNFRGEWKGPVLLYNALAQSMNVPSLKILDAIGFDAAINRAAALLDYTDSAQVRKMFPRVYPLGLGIISTSPLRMARAFAVFGNEGRAVTPIAIRTIEDRNGRVVIDVERDLRQSQRRLGDRIQVISPQNAYIMTRIMQKTVEEGSLASGSGWGAKFTFSDDRGSFRMQVAGKTGTPQNWSDAWAIGYSPYYTTAVWFGFDRPGNSLGLELTGATLAGPVWGDYMREIHRGLARRNFTRPSSGIVETAVCAKSGLLRTSACNQGEVSLPFLDGTQPTTYCDLHGARSAYDKPIPVDSMPFLSGVDESLFNSLSMPTLQLDLFPELQQNDNQRSGSQPANRNTTTRNTAATQNRRNQPPVSFNNPHLDDDLPETNVIDDPVYLLEEEEVEDDTSYYLPSWNPLD
jgi:penicillin-binding protein 1A